MTRRGWPAGAFAAGVLLLGCFELSSPPAGLLAVSPIIAAWPSVVDDDVMRDELGNEVPLRVEAYDGDGNLVTDATVTFIALDTGLTIDAGGVVRGANTRDTPARIIAQVSREGDVLETPELRIDVVPRPDSVAPARDTVFAESTFVSTRATPISTVIPVAVFSRRPSQAALPVKSWIVRYEILGWPDGPNGTRTAVFDGNPGATVWIDTTDATGGVASRTVTLQTVLMTKTGRDSVYVRVTVGNTRADRTPTVFTVTLPFLRQGP